MPPKPKTDEEIQEEKQIILENALNIISQKGYNNLTMREIASIGNYSTTKLYYYFYNKEHIMFVLASMGFNKLKESLIENTKDVSTPREKYINALKSVFYFGINSPNYWNLIFGIDTPKYLEFVDDEQLHDIVAEQKKIGEDFYDLFSDILIKYAESKNNKIDNLDIMAIFSRIAGIIHLNNCHILPEVYIDPEILFERVLEIALKEI